MKPITWESSRDEVLAAVSAHEDRVREIRQYSDDEIDWRGDPPGRRDGCYWGKDGNLRVHVRSSRSENPSLARQGVAGEEDQSQPGWDHGA